MVSAVTNDIILDLRGKATDTKPIGINCKNHNVDYFVGNGSTFFDMDNSEVYMLQITTDTEGDYVGAWVKI